MPSAIILLSTATGTEKAVLKSLKRHEYVQKAYVVQSAYDIIVKVRVETFDKLSAVISKIKRLSRKPQSIVTMLIVEGSTAQLTEKKNLGGQE
jgi:DNA-binding Lrp family transcriptional regulator